MNSNSQPLRRLLNYGRNYRGQTWQAAIWSVFNKLCDVAPEILIGIAVDVVVKKQDSFLARLGIQNVEQQLIVLTIITAIVWILESISQYIYTNLWRNLSQKIQHNLRLDAYVRPYSIVHKAYGSIPISSVAIRDRKSVV